MTYSIKEMFYTLQGEGTHAGRPAVFCRFSGCNLWNGREQDRSSARCAFCDTDFVGMDGTRGGSFDRAEDLAAALAALWPASKPIQKFTVLTGGEPLLQVDDPLVDALHQEGFFIAVETNGTVLPPRGLDWICISPKAGTALAARSGNELKVVVPQAGIDLDELIELNFGAYFLQPMDGPNLRENTKWAIEACLRDPRWKLSVQTHKIIGIR